MCQYLCLQTAGWPGEAALCKNPSIHQQEAELNAEPDLQLLGSGQPEPAKITLESHERSGGCLPGSMGQQEL